MTSAKEAALNVWKAFGSRDPAAIRAAFTPDGRWIAPPGNATAIAAGADAESVASVDGIIAFITGEAYPKLFRDVKVDFLKVIAEGDTVMIENIYRARLPNGRDYANRYCWVFEVRDGKVAEMREYMDTHGGFAQIFGDGKPRKLV
jgi:ketosteroid isomerase-like protein